MRPILYNQLNYYLRSFKLAMDDVELLYRLIMKTPSYVPFAKNLSVTKEYLRGVLKVTNNITIICGRKIYLDFSSKPIDFTKYNEVHGVKMTLDQLR
jgi:hypothetical protein